MDPTEHRNEHLKLLANWGNTLATGIFAAGVFIPSAQFIFHLLPADTDNGLVVGVALTSAAGGFVIHLFGQVFIGLMR